MNKNPTSRLAFFNIDRLIDLLCTVLAFYIAYLTKKYILPEQLAGLKPDVNYPLILFFILLIWYFMFDYFDVRLIINRSSLVKNLTSLALPVLISGLVLIMSLFVLKIEGVSRILIILFLTFDYILLSLVRGIIFAKLSDKYPLYSVFMVLIGTKLTVEDILNRVIKNSKGMEVAGHISLYNEENQGELEFINHSTLVNAINELEKILRQIVIDEIIFVMPINKLVEGEKLITVAQSIGVKIRIIPDLHINRLFEYKPKFYSISYEVFGEFPSLVFNPTPYNKGALFIKYLLDFLLSAIGLVLLLPLFLVIGILIKIKSPGPIFYKQERCGLFGRRFYMYKFRTMVPNADNLLHLVKDKNIADGPAFKVKDDPRIIPGIGKFLRSTGLDELPQLINVLKGEMSLIGPRPPIPEEVEKYSLWERRRLSMKPGITCLWQITPNRNLVPFSKWMEMDLYYIDNWSLWLDLKIALKTIFAVFKRYGM